MQHPSRSSPSRRSPLRAVPRADELELRPLLGVEEVAQLLGMPKATLYRWHSLSTPNTPQGPRAVRVGRYLRYTLEDLRRYIETLRMTSA
jgi:predicted DNA-binding transcriptional regulator AlpA